MRRSFATCVLIAISLSSSGAGVSAGVVALTTNSPSYTYNPRDGANVIPGTGIGDVNATELGNVKFNVESAAQGNASYYQPTTAGGSGTVSYTFVDATPGTAFNRLTLQTRSFIFDGSPGSVSGDYVTSNGTTGNFYYLSAGNIGRNVDNGTSGEADAIFIHDLSTAVTVTYTLTSTGSNPGGVQLFRSVGDLGGLGDYTYYVNGGFVNTPEPTAVALLGALGLPLLARRQNSTRAN